MLLPNGIHTFSFARQKDKNCEAQGQKRGRMTEKYSTMTMLEFDRFSKANAASHSNRSSIWNTGMFLKLTCL